MVNPALIPILGAIVKGIVTHPHRAMTAIKDNLHIATNDIEMPTVLAALRLEILVEQTAHAVKAAIASGQRTQALSDLVQGLGGLGTVLNEISTDPGTSITAGLLNARDDLSVSIMNAYPRSNSAANMVSLNSIWKSQSLLTNYFYPRQRLTGKVRTGAKVSKRYDTAATPHRRIEAHPRVSAEDKAILADIDATINPAAVQRKIRAFAAELTAATAGESEARPNARLVG